MKNLILATVLVLLVGTTFGQSFQKGNYLGQHIMTINPDPDVTLNQFIELFANKAISGWEKYFTGGKVYLLKGIRGENKNSFAVIYTFESANDRDKYWKAETGDFTELGKAAHEKMTLIFEDLNKLGTWTTKSTDWLVL